MSVCKRITIYVSRFLILSVFVSVTCSFSPVYAWEVGSLPGSFSSSFTFITDYHYRGVTLTDEKPAGQVSLDWSHESNFYLGIGSSNVDISDDDGADFEVDYYGGYSNEFGPYTADLTANYYSFPGSLDALNYEYQEFFFSLGRNFDKFDLAGSIGYSPGFSTAWGDAWYLKIAMETPLFLPDLKAVVHVGHQYIDDNSSYGFPDYTDWSVGLVYNFFGFDGSLTYVDTNLNNVECSNGCDARAVFSISRRFE